MLTNLLLDRRQLSEIAVNDLQRRLDLVKNIKLPTLIFTTPIQLFLLI